MLRLVHYSDDPNFYPRAEAGHGLEEKGCFFYLEGSEVEATFWSERYRTVWESPDGLGEVTNDFAPWEIDNPRRIIEIFIPADQLHLLQRIAIVKE